MPEVAVYDGPEINAFATGANRNNALVAVSTGLLQNMTEDEAEAVLAHEISHVANGDMVTMALLQGVLNTFLIVLARMVGGMGDGYLSGNRDGRRGLAYYAIVMVLEMMFGLFATMIAMWFLRYREFRADAGGASLAGRSKDDRVTAAFGTQPRTEHAAVAGAGVRHRRRPRPGPAPAVHEPPAAVRAHRHATRVAPQCDGELSAAGWRSSRIALRRTQIAACNHQSAQATPGSSLRLAFPFFLHDRVEWPGCCRCQSPIPNPKSGLQAKSKVIPGPARPTNSPCT